MGILNGLLKVIWTIKMSVGDTSKVKSETACTPNSMLKENLKLLSDTLTLSHRDCHQNVKVPLNSYF